MISFNLKKIIAKKPKIFNLFRLARGWAPFPLFYLVHLTLACNARCGFCYQKEGIRNNFRNDLLKLEDFKEILKQAKSFVFKRPLIHLFGGEPLLHPEFAEFLELAGKYRFPCALTTNGILLEKHLDKISAAGNLRQINISLYGVGEVHDKIVGKGGAFEDIISSVRQLQEMSGPRKIININCVVNKENYGKLAVFADFLSRYFKNREIDSLVFQYPMQKEFCREIDNPVFKAEIEKLKRIKSGFAIYFVSGKWFNNYRLAEPSFLGGSCNLPWLGLGILPNLAVVSGGSVLTCGRQVGNLKDKSLKKIWNGQELRDLRNQILKHDLSAACWGCCHANLK